MTLPVNISVDYTQLRHLLIAQKWEDADRETRRLMLYIAGADRVGWRNGEQWIGYNQIKFTLDAPVGHLPITWLVPTTFWMYWLARFASAGWRLLLERAIECNL